MTENELRSLISRSKEDGFKALFQQYKGYVYTIVWNRLRTVGTKEDAEECISDIFADVFLHYEEIHVGALQSYIGTVAKRTAIDAFRKLSSGQQTIPIDDSTVLSLLSEENIETDYETLALHRLLIEKIQSLGEPDATIIIQKYYYDRKSEEIAKAVHLQPVNVRVRLNRALKRLRKLLDDEGISL